MNFFDIPVNDEQDTGLFCGGPMRELTKNEQKALDAMFPEED